MKFTTLCVFAALALAQSLEVRAQQDLDLTAVQGRPDYSAWTPDAQAGAELERRMRKAMRKKMKLAAPRYRLPGYEGPNSGSPPPGGHVGEMDFAAPPQGDLEIVGAGSTVRPGRAGGPLTEILVGGAATELADDHTCVLAAREQNGQVVESTTDDGARITHIYALGDQGNRLRIHTSVAGRLSPVPGGVDMEPIFDRRP